MWSDENGEFKMSLFKKSKESDRPKSLSLTAFLGTCGLVAIALGFDDSEKQQLSERVLTIVIGVGFLISAVSRYRDFVKRQHLLLKAPNKIATIWIAILGVGSFLLLFDSVQSKTFSDKAGAVAVAVGFLGWAWLRFRTYRNFQSREI
jgi:uncharacterized membrane protein HdeD (DUF308 family)